MVTFCIHAHTHTFTSQRGSRSPGLIHQSYTIYVQSTVFSLLYYSYVCVLQNCQFRCMYDLIWPDCVQCVRRVQRDCGQPINLPNSWQNIREIRCGKSSNSVAMEIRKSLLTLHNVYLKAGWGAGEHPQE